MERKIPSPLMGEGQGGGDNNLIPAFAGMTEIRLFRLFTRSSERGSGLSGDALFKNKLIAKNGKLENVKKQDLTPQYVPCQQQFAFERFGLAKSR